MKSERCRVHTSVSGLVQGVGFRWFVQAHAARLGLSGWVRNLPDGRVEIDAEGERPDLETLLEQLHHGPSSARVEAVDTRWHPAKGETSGFEIR